MPQKDTLTNLQIIAHNDITQQLNEQPCLSS